MALDDLQQAWQAQSSHTRVSVDAELLRKEVQRNQQSFNGMIAIRDVREVLVGFALIGFWIYMGATRSMPWTWYLSIPALAWVTGFILVDRSRHMRTKVDPGSPLLQIAEESLSQTEHQIRLLRNVFWWYLLPLLAPMLAFFAQSSIQLNQSWGEAFAFSAGMFCFVIVIVIGALLDYVNQFAIRSQLAPRRQELLTLIATLQDDSVDPATPDEPPEGEPFSSLIRRWSIVSALALSVALACSFFTEGTTPRRSQSDGPSQHSGPAGESLARLVDDLRTENGLVGLAAMIMTDGRLEAAAACGERKIGTGIPVTLADQWHLGGIAKPVTATMIARLIESGRMDWTNTVGDIFPGEQIHPDWKSVTVMQLLTDTAGAPANFPRHVFFKHPPEGPQRTQARRQATLEILAAKPEFPPGSENLYSNVGYSILGAMAEQATGVTWEDLVRQEVFAPLGFSEAGFGPPESPTKTLPQPRGHDVIAAGKRAANDDSDNTPIMWPAGAVRMTLDELSAFAREHEQGRKGQGKLLKKETYERLHTPVFNHYASGWSNRELAAGAPFPVYWHNGANTMWYALVAFIPDKNMTVAVVSNDGDFRSAESAALEIVEASVDGSLLQRASEAGQVEYRKASPFAAIRWNDSQPEVKVDDTWYRLVSIDSIPIDDILAFSRRIFASRWQKRFEEDLVELLALMEHPLGDHARLVVQPLNSDGLQTLEAVPVTESNRQAIRRAARQR